MNDILGSRAFLAAYAGILTAVLPGTVLSGMAWPATTRFDVIEVERTETDEFDRGRLAEAFRSVEPFPRLPALWHERHDPERPAAAALDLHRQRHDVYLDGKPIPGEYLPASD